MNVMLNHDHLLTPPGNSWTYVADLQVEYLRPTIHSMFFLREKYQYGDPRELPEKLDMELCRKLLSWAHDQPEHLFDNLDQRSFYPGPHGYLHLMAVLHELRSRVGSNTTALTAELVQQALDNQRNWPTRGYLERDIDGNLYENQGDGREREGIVAPVDNDQYISR